MPAIINQYAITPDLLRLMVKQTETLNGVPDLINLNYGDAKPVYTVGAFTLEKVPSTDSAYHLKFNIIINNKLLGFILTDRTKKYGFNKNLRPIHVNNEAFYTLDFANLLSNFLWIMGLKVANHTQLDIAIDTQQVDPAKLIHSYTSKPGKYQRIKRKNDGGIITHGPRNEITGKQEFTTYINQGSQTVAVKMYNKTNELAATKSKAYILDWYAANGFDLSKDVWRMEITIKAKALREYTRYAVTEDGEVVSAYKASSKAARQTEITTYVIDIEKLNNKAYLCQLFRQFFPIDIRKTDATRPTNCTRVELVDWTIYPQEAINTTVEIKATKNNKTMEKKMLHQHIIDYNETGDELYLKVAEATAARHDLNAELEKILAVFQRKLNSMEAKEATKRPR